MASRVSVVQANGSQNCSDAEYAQIIPTQLLSLPLDVLLEIFGRVEPFDIWVLTRTSKALRQILMSRSSLSAWKAAIRNDEAFPECPEDMSMPQFMSLLSDKYCLGCGLTEVRVEFLPLLRTRLCPECAESQTICFTEIQASLSFDLETLISDSVPKMWTFISFGSNKFYYLHGKCNAIDPRWCFLKADIDRFLKEYNNTGKDTRYGDGIASHWTRICLTDKQKTAWDRWRKFSLLRQEGRVDEIIKQRRNDIESKLCRESYGRAMKYIRGLEDGCRVHEFPGVPEVYYMDYHPHVQIAKLLSEQEWSRIKGEMIDFAKALDLHSQARDRMLLKKRRMAAALKEYTTQIDKFPPETLLPSLVDMLDWEPVRKLVEAEGPSQEWAIGEPFQILFKRHLKKFVAQFQADNLRTLVLLTPHQIDDSSTAAQLLQKLKLATTVFQCAHDVHELMTDFHRYGNTDGRDDPEHMPLFYPEFLHHICNSIDCHDCESNHWLDWRDRANDEYGWLISVDEACGECYERTKWAPQWLQFDHKAKAVIERIVRACGRDPETTTAAEMDGLDPRLVCLKCSFNIEPDGERICTVWTWRSAVRHCLRKHWGNSTVHWRMTSFEDAATARLLQAAEVDRRGLSPGYETIWRCTHCRNRPSDQGRMDLEDVKRHCVLHHDQANPIYKTDYYKAVDAAPPQPFPVRIRPKPAAADIRTT